MNERLDQIRQRLQAATPGPWHTVDQPWGKGNWVSTAQDPHAGRAICDCEATLFGEDDNDEWEGSEYANATFIAHAPSDIAYLLDQLHTTQAEVERVRREMGELYATIFRDGGHRQQELDAIPGESYFGAKWPRRLAEACEVVASLHHAIEDDASLGILRKAARLTKESDAKITQATTPCPTSCGACEKGGAGA